MEIITIVFTGWIVASSLLWFYRKKRTVLHPFAFIAAICFLVQVVAPLFWEFNGIRRYRGVPIMDYIIPTELIFLLGYLAFWISYNYAIPKPKIPKGYVRYNDGTIDVDVSIQTVYLLWLICFFLYNLYLMMKGRSLLSQLTLGQRGSYYNDTSLESGFLFLAISLNMLITTSCVMLFTGRGKTKYVFFIVAFLLTVSAGRRHLMLDIALAPLIVLYSKRKENPSILTLTIAVIVAYLLVGWIGAMREVYRFGTGNLTAYDRESAWSAVMINLEVFMPLCMYIPNLKSLSSFALGSSYITAFLQIIPSIIFPYKAKVISFFTRGLVTEALGARFLEEGIAGTYWSLLYANGWIFGVILGMSFLGRWVKNIETNLRFERLTYTVEFALLTTFMFQFTTRSFGNAIQDLLGLMLPLFILRRYPPYKMHNV